MRSGDLTSIYMPQEEDEASRHLSRAREDALGDRSRPAGGAGSASAEPLERVIRRLGVRTPP